MLHVTILARFFIYICWFFGPVDAREACFGPCVVAAAYVSTRPDTLACAHMHAPMRR